MLRKKVYTLATEKQYRPKVKSFLKVASYFCLLWLMLLPYFSRGHFTAENALGADMIRNKSD